MGYIPCPTPDCINGAKLIRFLMMPPLPPHTMGLKVEVRS